MKYIKNIDGHYNVVESDSDRALGMIINYESIGWEFQPYPYIRLSYILLRRLYNKVYQLRKRDGQK